MTDEEINRRLTRIEEALFGNGYVPGIKAQIDEALERLDTLHTEIAGLVDKRMEMDEQFKFVKKLQALINTNSDIIPCLRMLREKLSKLEATS